MAVFQGIYEHGLYVSTLYELLEREPRIALDDNPVPIELPLRTGIEFQNVSFTYPGKDEPALDRCLLRHQTGRNGRAGRS